MPLFGQMKILDTLVGLGIAALAAIVALLTYIWQSNFLHRINEVLERERERERPIFVAGLALVVYF